MQLEVETARVRRMAKEKKFSDRTRKMLDRMLDYPFLYASAGGFIHRLDPREPMLLAIILHHEKMIVKLKKILASQRGTLTIQSPENAVPSLSTQSEKIILEQSNEWTMVPTTIIDIRKLIEKVEKSQVPLAEEAEPFEKIKAKTSRGEHLDKNELDLLARLASKAGKWEKSVEASALTEPKDTLPAD